MTIADTSNLKFQGNASQDAVVLMKIGDVVRVMVDGMGGPGYAGRVSQVGPIAAATGQYFPIAISIVNDRKLLAGMTGKAVFHAHEPEGVVIPFRPSSPRAARLRSSSFRRGKSPGVPCRWDSGGPPMFWSSRAWLPANRSLPPIWGCSRTARR